MDPVIRPNVPILAGLISPDGNNTSVPWLADQPQPVQHSAAREGFERLLQSASQPRHLSGNSCIKLCYFVEQCKKSSFPILRDLAFSNETCLQLFNFYVEWNERNQHRSMRQVLELLATLISGNPNIEATETLKAEILQRLLSIITHQASQPLVKPAFKVLECLLGKGSILVSEVLTAYEACTGGSRETHSISCALNTPMDSFVADTFDWMSLPDTSPAAGKLLVTLFREAKQQNNGANRQETHPILWQRWIRQGLSRHPQSLENIKNYLFPPLFKLDRVGSIELLEDLAKENVIGMADQGFDSQAFLLLSAMEVGKKLGLVDEIDDTLPQQRLSKQRKFVPLPLKSIGALLGHSSSTVRSLAFSVLVCSLSTTKPFSGEALDLIRASLHILHADTDGKFRNETLSNTKHLVERLRGATSVLSKGLIQTPLLIATVVGHSGRMPPTELTPTQSLKDPDIAVTAANTHYSNTDLLEKHKEFILWYLRFLEQELVPTASYPRHITALSALLILVSSGLQQDIPSQPPKTEIDSTPKWHVHYNIYTASTTRLLLWSVLDPYEDVRILSTSLLKQAPTAVLQMAPISVTYHKESVQVDAPSMSTIDAQIPIQTTSLQKSRPMLLERFLEKANEQAEKTGRAHLSDGASKLQMVLFEHLEDPKARYQCVESLVNELQEALSIAERDLGEAAQTAPIHRIFSALRHLWEPLTPGVLGSSSFLEPSEWASVQLRILGYCESIWDTVSGILCNDAPEGHVPDCIESIEEPQKQTQALLSYSFRAIHESSNLIRAMVSKTSCLFADGSNFMPPSILESAGDLTFKQLATLRHRGAFSTVSDTFSIICQATQENSMSGSKHLLQRWYQEAMECIKTQSSTTRRSAGLPALVTGILSARSKEVGFEKVMQELLAVAQEPAKDSKEDEVQLPQVHAMNSAREVFKNSGLRKFAQLHTSEFLRLAAEGLKSERWAIRNCALILFRSLMDVLFGTSESKATLETGWDGKSVRISYDQNHHLPGVLLELLTPSKEVPNFDDFGVSSGDSAQGVFLALEILRRAGPPPELRQEMYAATIFYLGSEIWSIRDLAARVCATLLINDEEWIDRLLRLLDTYGCEGSNKDHGIMLTVKALLGRRLDQDLNAPADGLKILLERVSSLKPNQIILQKEGISFHEMVTSVLRVLLKTFVYKGKPVPFSIDSLSNELFFENATKLVAENLLGSFAALRKTVATRAVVTAALNSNPKALEELIEAAAIHDPDTADTILEEMAYVFDTNTLPGNQLASVADIYVLAINADGHKFGKAGALNSLADVLDRLWESNQSLLTRTAEFCSKSVECIWNSVSKYRTYPELIHSMMRIQGCLLLRKHQGSLIHTEELALQVPVWAQKTRHAMDKENDINERTAAVNSLKSFWLHASGTFRSQFFFDSLLVLYDTLYDDDEDIRDVGANVVSIFLGRQAQHHISLVPLAAQKALLLYFLHEYGQEDFFHAVFVRRALCLPVESHMQFVPQYILTSAKEFATVAEDGIDDDGLFAVEDQNLYDDTFRGAAYWISLLVNKSAKGSLWDKTAESLTLWGETGKSFFNSAQEEFSESHLDFVLSKPDQFSLFARTVNCCVAIKIRTELGLQGCTVEGDKKDQNINVEVDVEQQVGMKGFGNVKRLQLLDFASSNREAALLEELENICLYYLKNTAG